MTNTDYTYNEIEPLSKSHVSLLDTQNKTMKTFVPEKSIKNEAYILVKLAFPIGLSFAVQAWQGTMTCTVLGQLPNSSEILAASAIAMSFTMIFVICISWGFSSAIWTLIPQYVGSNQMHLIALSVQRAFLVCFVLQIPLSISVLYSRKILEFIGVNKDNDISWDLIIQYCYLLFPVPFLFWTVSIVQHICQYLNLAFELTVITCVTFVVSTFGSYMVVHTFNFGFIGSSIVNTINYAINIAAIIALLIYKGHGSIFKPLSIYQICDKNGLYQYLRLAFPSAIELILRWSMRFLPPMLTGFLTNSHIATAITNVLFQLSFTEIHSGVGYATGIRIGKYIGANRIGYAKRCIKIQIFYELVLMMIFVVICIVFRNSIPKLLTNDSAVSSLISDKFIYIYVINQLCCAIHVNTTSVYRALGYQKITGILQLTVQWLIALPLCLYLLFSDTYNYQDDMIMGLYVIWFCDAFGYLLVNVVLIYMLVYHIDWNKAVEDSNKRIKCSNENNKNYYAKLTGLGKVIKHSNSRNV